MNFLELCVRLRQEAGYSGSGPESVVSQTGVYKKLVDWVASAYIEVQKEEMKWDFLWSEAQFNTVVGQKDYSPVSDLGLADLNALNLDSFFIERAGSNTKQELDYENYEVFRQFRILNHTASPSFFTQLPNKSIRLDSAPINAEVVSFEYWKKPVPFSAGDDEPIFPQQHHNIILYRALMYYAADQEAGNIYAESEKNYKELLKKLREDQLSPELVSWGALA